MNRGKLAVVSILVLGAALAGFAWWWNYQHGRRCLEFWGDQGALRIRQAPEATMLWLRPEENPTGMQQLVIGGRSYAVIAAQEVGQARGMIHARHALLDDASFEWTASAASPPSEYALAVRFADARGTTTAAFDFARRRIAHVEGGREQSAAAKIVAGWRSFADREAPVKSNQSPPRK